MFVPYLAVMEPHDIYREIAAGVGMTKAQGEGESVVLVVDDDGSVQQALTSLVRSVALHVEAFGSAADFLKRWRIANSIAAACLIS
jgi:hypothetical protein